MLRSSLLQSLALGLLVTVAQVALAVEFSNPDGNLVARWRSLVQHDSFWFANIIDRGYGTTLPPIDHKEMEVSNVAFFPAYPLLAKALSRLTTIDTYASLLLIAQAATWLFWTYFFLFCQRWTLSPPLQLFGALAIAAHPAAFYLVAGYSESLFLASLAGLIYWSTREGKRATTLAVLHGVVLSATRIVGLPCAAFPMVHAFFNKEWWRGEKWRIRLTPFRRPLLVMLCAMLGGLAFFAWCQVRWGRWDLYMLTQNQGWAIVPDYLAPWRPQNYLWSLPPFFETTRVSQFTSALAGAFFLVVAAAELMCEFFRRGGWRERIGFYFCAGVIYYLSLAGVASVQLESMLRYDLCVHALVVLGLLHLLGQLRPAPALVKGLSMAAAAIAFAAGLALQGYYVWNFTQGNWVA